MNKSALLNMYSASAKIASVLSSAFVFLNCFNGQFYPLHVEYQLHYSRNQYGHIDILYHTYLVCQIIFKPFFLVLSSLEQVLLGQQVVEQVLVGQVLVLVCFDLEVLVVFDFYDLLK